MLGFLLYTMTQKIAIQGFEGSFHQVAANKYFKKVCPIIPCSTFRELIKVTENETNTIAVMAIENSIAGSILPNYNLLVNSQLKIVGEIYLAINQNLLVNKGVQLTQIKEVHSHPMAILQCINFLETYKWKLVETEDTALSAKLISQHKNLHTAAIGSKLAAELFNLNILFPNIQTAKNNVTRFLILNKSTEIESTGNYDKISLYFQTDNSKGILSKILNIIHKNGFNLSKLQSMPIPGSRFKYGFYVDIQNDNINKFYQMLNKLKENTIIIKILGIYRNGKNYKA